MVSSHLNRAAVARVLEELVQGAWASTFDLFSPELIQGLATEVAQRHQLGWMQPALIGRQVGLLHDGNQRGDSIQWLDPTGSTAERSFLEAIEELMALIRSELYVPVRTYEAHFACYEAGRHYAKHKDRFRDADERELSTVLFLNPEWKPQDQGQLLIFDPDREDRVLAEVLPELGRFVLFRSDRVPHEVLAPHKPRYSIAGWMRRQSGVLT